MGQEGWRVRRWCGRKEERFERLVESALLLVRPANPTIWVWSLDASTSTSRRDLAQSRPPCLLLVNRLGERQVAEEAGETEKSRSEVLERGARSVEV